MPQINGCLIQSLATAPLDRWRFNISGKLAILPLILILAGCGNSPESETVRHIETRSQTLKPLTPGEGKDAQSAVRAALLLDPSVREQASLTGASVDQIAIERSALMPSLSFGLVAGVGEVGAGDPDIELSGNQVLVDFGGRKRAIKAADVNLQIQYLKFQATVDASISTALITYRQVAMLQNLIKVKAAHLASMEDLHKLITERINIGASSSPDLLEIRNRMERAAFDLQDAKMELAEMRDKLLRLTGRSDGGMIPNFTQTCGPPDGETDQLRIARLELVKARLNLEGAQRARLPSISLNPVGRAGIGTDGIKTGMNVEIGSPLFNGGAIKARENAARNLQRSAEALVEAEQRNIRLDDLRLRRQISSLKEKQLMLARQITLLAETRDLYYTQYIKLGTRQITDLLDAEESLHLRKAELVEAGFDLQKRLVECAARSKVLRRELGLNKFQTYGYPLTADGF
ncbi:TolC family protein [Pontibaca salina]|uniref:TolC family protein n=1 Tax=Pontibaca salina TaxID=2795731 RepID=A0A934HR44_9RHOB|nr:TolC family protein [Pontibaca salina]MBI6629105.1 TolC family protein [Pontibaca salina]